jgi:hypothetical protein
MSDDQERLKSAWERFKIKAMESSDDRGDDIILTELEEQLEKIRKQINESE